MANWPVKENITDMSTCAKCGNHMFSIQEQSPIGSAFKVYFVQCSSCGAPIGVLEYSNSGVGIENLAKKLAHVNSTVEQISYDVQQIKAELTRRR